MSAKQNTEKDFSAGVVPAAPWRLSKVEPLPGYCLDVTFNDGTHGFVEMQGLIYSERSGVFAVLKDKDIFTKVYLEHGVVTWPGEIDLSPDTMYSEIKKHGKWVLD